MISATPSPEAYYVFADTNLFLQARALPELPWHELAPNRDIILLVPRAVQKEISRLKSDGNNRRAKRARASSTLLLQTAQAPGHTITIRERDPRVTLALPSPTVQITPPEDLDANNPDDQIMAEVLAFRAHSPDKISALLTGDTDQIVSAVHHHVPYHVLPNSWLLSPEPDERDKRITELEHQVRTLKSTEPVIHITHQDENENPLEVITIECDEYSSLTDTTIEELITEAQQRQPPQQGLDELVGKTRPPDSLGRKLITLDHHQRYKPPTAEQVSNYYEHQYPNWITNLREAFARLDARLRVPSRYASATIRIENRGTRPADGLILTIKAHGDIQLTRKPPEHKISIPQPPAPPKGEYTSVGRNMQDMLNSMGVPRQHQFQRQIEPFRRDPNAFYREYGDEPTNEWALTCDEFRHGSAEQREIGIIIPQDWRGTKAAITVTVTARNMSHPATSTIPVRINHVLRDTTTAARTLLDQYIKRIPQVTITQRDQGEKN